MDTVLLRFFRYTGLIWWPIFFLSTIYFEPKDCTNFRNYSNSENWKIDKRHRNLWNSNFDMLIRLSIHKSVNQPKDEEKTSILKILNMNHNCTYNAAATIQELLFSSWDYDITLRAKTRFNFFWVRRQKWMGGKKLGLKVYGKQGSSKS